MGLKNNDQKNIDKANFLEEKKMNSFLSVTTTFSNMYL